MPILLTLFDIAKKLDKLLLLLINNDAHRSVLDPVMIFLSKPHIWVTLYLFLAWFAMNKKSRIVVPFLVLSVSIIAVSDLCCSHILKILFERARPCNDPELSGVVRVLVDCPNGFSFPSNLSADHFALATSWYLYCKRLTDRKWWWLLVAACASVYSQVYVGKDFPSDSIVGATIGMLIGWLIYTLAEQVRRARIQVVSGSRNMVE